ncbi:unnamed protein product [Caenorhabditis angaria]|uniref:Uncharacterized protein n=1 Tax=Caenorhabditis angaria TaxID=860376 RepID=A0A9P1IHY1_9PELO|nr:unnamed protein product [Caenorhabditis angaria]
MLKSPHSRIFFQQSRSHAPFRAVRLSGFWDRFRIVPPDLLPSNQKAVEITRTNRSAGRYLNLSYNSKSPYIIFDRPGEKSNWWKNLKTKGKTHVKNMFVHGVGLQKNSEDILENGQSVFFEVLRAIRENDFSSLSPYTLGGSKTFQFHRQEINRLNSLQKTAFDITEADLMGKNGHIVTYPYFEGELGSFINEISYVHLDANGEATYGENGEPVIYCLYKLIFGAVYKFEMLDNQISKYGWNQKNIYPMKEYKFKFPRNVIVELDICQQVQVPRSIPTKLKSNRLLYDFHVFSF